MAAYDGFLLSKGVRRGAAAPSDDEFEAAVREAREDDAMAF